MNKSRREFLAASPLGFCLFGIISGKGLKASHLKRLNPNQRLCFDYLSNIFLYLNGLAYPDERLMRGIEDKIDISEVHADDFRRSIAAYIGHVMWHGQKFDWDTSPELKKAFELYMKEKENG